MSIKVLPYVESLSLGEKLDEIWTVLSNEIFNDYIEYMPEDIKIMSENNLYDALEKIYCKAVTNDETSNRFYFYHFGRQFLARRNILLGQGQCDIYDEILYVIEVYGTHNPFLHNDGMANEVTSKILNSKCSILSRE